MVCCKCFQDLISCRPRGKMTPRHRMTTNQILVKLEIMPPENGNRNTESVYYELGGITHADSSGIILLAGSRLPPTGSH